MDVVNPPPTTPQLTPRAAVLCRVSVIVVLLAPPPRPVRVVVAGLVHVVVVPGPGVKALLPGLGEGVQQLGQHPATQYSLF